MVEVCQPKQPLRDRSLADQLATLWQSTKKVKEMPTEPPWPPPAPTRPRLTVTYAIPSCHMRPTKLYLTHIFLAIWVASEHQGYSKQSRPILFSWFKKNKKNPETDSPSS